MRFDVLAGERLLELLGIEEQRDLFAARVPKQPFELILGPRHAEHVPVDVAVSAAIDLEDQLRWLFDLQYLLDLGARHGRCDPLRPSPEIRGVDQLCPACNLSHAPSVLRSYPRSKDGAAAPDLPTAGSGTQRMPREGPPSVPGPTLVS